MSPSLSHSSNGRSAFLLNAKAKSVGGALLDRLIEMVPTGDLYLSHSINDSQKYVRTILDKGYGQVFSGGGDGTLMNTISTIYQLAKEQKCSSVPQVGVLRLGTGNAVASVLGAQRPLVDVNHVLSGGRIAKRPLHMIRCDDGSLAPFAGIGLDGEIINDYSDLKTSVEGKVTERLLRTAFGYVWAGLTKTAVRHVNKPHPMVRIKTKNAAIQKLARNGVDVGIDIPAGTTLYEGPASMVSVGSIPCFGYGFQMFPFLKDQDQAKKMQLRICTAGVWPIVSNLYPSLWKGTYRGDYVFDYLVDQVTIESEEMLPYQVAGDARGYRKNLSFSLAENCVQAVELDRIRLPFRRGVMGLLPAHALAR